MSKAKAWLETVFGMAIETNKRRPVRLTFILHV